MAQTNAIPLMFPVKGIVRGASFREQEELTCYDALNVRPHDSIERRRRGGQRTGQAKYFADPVNGVNAIQAISSVVRAFDASTIIPDELIQEFDFTAYATGQLTTVDPTNFPADYNGGQPNNPWTTTTPATTFWPNINTADGINGLGHSGAQSAINVRSVLLPSVVLGSQYLVRLQARAGWISGATSTPRITMAFRIDPTTHLGYYSVRLNNASADPTGFVKVIVEYVTNAGTGSTTTLITSTGYQLTRTGSNNYSDAFDFDISVSGNKLFVYINNVELVSALSIPNVSSRTRIALGTMTAGSRILGVIDTASVFTGIIPQSLRSTDIVVVSAGQIYAGTPANGLLPSTSGSGMLAAGRLGIQPAFQKAYFADGLSSGYKVLDVASNTVSTWTPTAGSLPVGSVDATRACRIIALYRGRIVLAGLSEDAQNWFMARAGDPLDWDYTPATTDATQPVAGNNSEAGLLGDIVTCLAPYQDDLLFMGGDHTLWVMRGDPAAGGQIDNISRQVGIVGPEAFTWDFSRLYFLAQSGLYRVDAGGGNLEKIDRNRLDKVFDAVNYATNNIRLVYDRAWQGVHIFITPVNEPAAPTDHWFWDERTDSFWRDQYPTNHGPTAVHLYDADDPDDRAVLLGGFDGYIRYFSDAVASDDGEAIDSYVQFTPLKLEGDLYNLRLHELQMIMGAGSNDVTLSAYTGKSAEEAVTAASAQFSSTLVAGRNNSIRRRARANTLMLKLRNNTLDQTWAFESGMAFVQQAGKILKAR
ncbi:MAG: hypothetical protein IT442_04930 [Phycisphaeraceae bacterium]|nr:hypothetical protein [Phycisphaeraceae bacterium]